MLCALILCKSGPTYSLKSTPIDRFLRSFSWQFYLLLRVFAKNLLRGSRRRSIFIFSLEFLAWGLNSGLTSNKPTRLIRQHTSYYFAVVTLSQSQWPWHYRSLCYVSFHLTSSAVVADSLRVRKLLYTFFINAYLMQDADIGYLALHFLSAWRSYHPKSINQLSM